MRREGGFTFTEMMVVLAIFALLSVIAIPNFLSWRTDAKFRGAVNNLKADLNWARLSAARLSGRVLVEFQQADLYVICQELDTDESCTTVDDELKRRTLPAEVSIDFAATDFPDNGSSKPYTIYNSRGLPEDTGKVVIVSARGETQDVELNRLGRINTP